MPRAVPPDITLSLPPADNLIFSALPPEYISIEPLSEIFVSEIFPPE